MLASRRQFLSGAALGGLGLAVAPLLAPAPATAARPAPQLPRKEGAPMAVRECRYYRAHSAQPGTAMDAVAWIQIDLGESREIDAVKLFPLTGEAHPREDARLHTALECANQADFAASRLIAHWHGAARPVDGDDIREFSAKGTRGRYLRLTATRPESARTIRSATPPTLALAKIEVLSGNAALCFAVNHMRNIHCPF